MMSKTKPTPGALDEAVAWTPGPWEVVEPSDEFDNISVCAFEGDPRDGIMSEVIAEVVSLREREDGRLIAAAPVMAEALKIAIQLAEQIQRGMVTPLGAAKLIADNSRAALSSARGEG